MSGGSKTISQTGSLNVLPGPVSRATTIAFPGTPGLALLQLDLRASSVEALLANRLALRCSGTGDEANDVLSASLFVDVDSDGRLSTLDRPIVTGVQVTANDGALVFDNLNQSIPASSVTRWLVVFDLAANIAEGSTFALTLEDNADFQLTGATSLQSIQTSGAPITGTTVTVNLVPSSPVAITASQETIVSGTLTPDQSRATLFALRLTETGNDAARLTALTLSSSGSGNENSDIIAVTLFRDLDNNQSFSTGDIPIATGVYSGDDGRITFARLDETIPALSSRDFIVTYDMADGTQVRSGEIFNVELLAGDLILESANIGQPLTPTGLPLSGASRQVPSVGALDVTVPNPITQLELAANQQDVPALRFRLTETGNDPVLLNSIAVRSSGSGQDDTDILQVKLIQDNDSSGTLSPGDTVLSTTSFAQDNGITLFNNLNVQIPALGSLDLVVTIDSADSGQVNQGETFALSIVPGDIDALSTSLQSSAAQTGLPISGPTLTVTESVLEVSRGLNSPLVDTSVFTNAPPTPLLQLAFRALNLGTVRIDRVDIQAAGSGNPADDIASASLILDVNGNGLIDNNDTVLQTRNNPFQSSAIASFTNIDFNVSPGPTQFVIIAYSFAPSAVLGSQFTVSIPSNGIGVAAPATVSGLFPLTGRTLTVGGGRLSVSQPPISATTFSPGTADVPALRLRFTETDNAAVTLQSLRVSSLGSGDESTDILFATLRLDSDGDGLVSNGDVVLGGASFMADNGEILFNGLGQSIPGLATVDFLITLTAANQSQLSPGENFQFSVGSNGVVAVSNTVGQPVSVLGLPQTGPLKSVEVPNFTVQQGPRNPQNDVTAFAGTENLVTLQLAMTAPSGAAVTVTGIDIRASGTGQDANDVGALKLFRDVNGDGLLDPGDTLIRSVTSPFPADNGLAVVNGFSETVFAGQTALWLVVYDLNPSAALSSTYASELSSANGLRLLQQATISGTFPITSRSIRIGAGAITVSQSGAVGNLIEGNQTGVPMLRLRLTESSGDAVQLTSLSVTGGGTGQENQDIALVRLHRDLDGNGMISAGDELLGASTFITDNGKARFLGLTLTIPGNGQEELLISYDSAANSGLQSGETFFASVQAGDLSLQSISVGQSITPTGLPQTGVTREVPAANLSVQLGSQNPTGNLTVFDADSGLVMTQFSLAASNSADIVVESVTINASGSGADQDDIASARLFIDVNGDGLLDVGDTLIQSLSDPFGNTDNGSATFSGLNQTINAGQTENWILVYDLNGNAANGAQFNVQITANTDIAVTAPATVSGVFPISGRSLTVGGGAITVSQPGATGATIEGNQVNVPMLRLALQETDNEAVTLTSVTLSSGGTGNSATDFTSVKLYLDANKDGQVDPGDSLIAAGQFSGGSLSFNGLSQSIAALATEELLVVVDTASLANLSANETFFIQSTAITANSDSVGRSITVTGAAQTGNTRTVPAADLSVQAGSANPSGSLPVFDADTNLVMTQFSLAASSTSEVVVESVTVNASGSGADQDDIANARLFIDVNGDGLLDAGDTLIQSLSDPFGNTDNGSATFSGLNQTINAGQTENWILVYDLNGNAANGSQFNVQITANTDITVTAPATVSGGFPISGRSLTVGGGAITVTQPGATGTTIEGGQINVPMLRLALQETDNEAVTVTSVTLSSGGTGNSATDFNSVKLYLDANKDGQVDSGDSLLAAGQFSGGSLSFNGLSQSIAALATEELLVVVDTASLANLSANETFFIQSTAITANSDSVGRSITVTGAAQTGNTRTVPAADLSVQAGSANPSGSLPVFDADTNLVMTQFSLAASSTSDVVVESVTINASGSGADQDDITSARLFIDVNGDGLLDAGDTLIQSLSDPFGNTDNGSATFSGLNQTINAGQTENWILVYDLNGNAANGAQFNVQITANTDIAVTAPATVSGVFPISGRSLTVGGGAITVSQPGATGATIEGNQVNVPMLRLALQETDNEAVTLTSVTLSSGGTGNSATDFNSVKLYLDANKDGQVDPGDSLLAAGQFSGGSLSFNGLSQSIAALATEELLVVVDTASLANLSANETFSIQSTAITANSDSVGRSITVTGAAQTGNTRTVPAADLSVQAGSANPSGSLPVFDADTNLVMTQFSLAASSTSDVVVESVTINASGSGADQDDIASARLFIDVNGDGLLDAGDTLIQSLSDPFGNTDNGSATFSGLNQTINAGQTENWILVYDLNGNAANGSQFNVQITANTDITVTAPATVSGVFPISGRSLTVGGGAITVTQPGATGATIEGNQINVPMLRLALQETDNEAVTVTSLTLSSGGTGNSATDFDSVKLYLDANKDGQVDPGDSLLAAGQFSGGSLSFDGLTVALGAGANEELLVVVDTASLANLSANETFSIQSTAITANSDSVGRSITVTGAAQTGNTRTVPAADLSVQVGSANPSGSLPVFDADSGLVMTQFSLAASSASDVVVESVTINASGSGADQDDIASARLFIDVNGDGLLDAGDTLIQSLSDPFGNTDNGSATFSGLNQTINAGQTENWILVYDLNGNAANGAQFNVQITANTDIAVTAPATVSGVFPISGRSLTVGGGAITVTQPGATGTTIEGGQVNVPMLRLALQETDNEAVTVTSVTLSSGGTGNSATDFNSVKLYLDANKDGQVDSGDSLLAAGQFSGGTLRFDNLTVIVSASGNTELLVAVDTAAKTVLVANQTLSISTGANSILAESNSVGREIVVTNSAQTGNSRVVATPNLEIQSGSANPGGTLSVGSGGTNLVMTQFSLNASSAADVTVESVTINASGSGADQDDIASARLFIDVNGDGLLDAGDTLIQSLSDPFGNTDNGSATFSGINQTINAGQTENWILVYDLNGNAANGSQFNVQITANTDITVTSPATVSGGFPILGRSLLVSDATAVLSQASTPSTILVPNATDLSVIHLRLAATGADNIRLTSLTADAFGSGNDQVDLVAVKLYRDNNQDGLVDPGDSLIQSGAFNGDNGQVTFSALSETVTAGQSRDFIIAYDSSSPANLTPGETFQVRILNGNVGLVSTVSNQPVIPMGLPQIGSLFTVPVQEFTVQPGLVNPSGNRTVFDSETNLVMFQARLSAPAALNVIVESVTVNASGSGADQDDIASARLFIDVNGDGVLDAGDTLIQSLGDPFGNTDNGSATFSGINQTINAGQTENWILVYDLNGNAANGSQFNVQITANTDIAVTAPATVSGVFPISGRSLTVGGGAITVTQPGATGTTIEGGQVNVPMLRLALQETDNEAVTLTSVTLSSGGTGNSATDFNSVKLYLDANKDGQVDSGDSLLAAGQFSGGSLSFNGLSQSIAALATEELLVVVDTASLANLSANETFSMQSTAIAANSDSVGRSITVTGAAQTGNTRTVPAADLSVQVGAKNPTGNLAVLDADTNLVMTQFSLTASSSADIVVESVAINASGSGADQDDIASARLFIDVNGDGVLDAGDTLIQSLSDPFGNTDNGSATFSGINQTINAGQTENWILIYDLNGNAANGAQFNVQITANTDITVTAPATVSGVFPISGRSLTVGGGAITVTQPGATGTTIEGNQINVPMLRLALQETDNEAVTVTSVTLSSGGTGNSATDFNSVKLYLDANKDGQVDPGDSLLAAGQFSGGSLSFNGLSQSIAALATEELLVVVDTASLANLSANETFSIQSTAITANSDSVGRSITVTGAAQTGNTRTVPAADLSVQAGSANPSGNLAVFDSDTNLVMTQFSLTASNSADIVVESVTINASGSGADQDDIASARLFVDVNGDGVLDAGDTLIQSLSDPFGNTDNGSATFSGINQTINAGQTENWILVYDLNGNAANGAQFNVQITANTDITVTAPATVSGGFPLSGRSLTVGGGAITVSQPGATGATIEGNQVNVPMLRLALQETDNEAVTLTSVTLSSGGTGNSATDFNSVKLYLDANKDGQVDSGDSLLAAGQFSGGSLSFDGLSQSIAALATEELLVVVDTASLANLSANETFSIQSTAITANSDSVGRSITVTGAAQTGNTRTVPAADLSVQVGAKNPTGNLAVFDADTNLVMTQFSLTASSSADIVVESVTINASGSGADQDDIASARLFIDVNGDGLLDAGDTLIQSLSDPFGNTDNGSATFSGINQTINAGQTENWILVYDLNGNAANGSQFNVQITANTDITVTAPATVSGSFPLSGRSLTVGGGAITVTQPGATGTTIEGGQVNVPMLRLALQETDNEAVTVTSVTLSSGGTGNSATDFNSVKLYLDANKDGQVDSGDSLLAAGQFSGGILSFNGLSQNIAALATEELLVVVDTAPKGQLTAGQDLSISSSAIAVNSNSVQKSVSVTGAAQTGTSRVIATPNLDIQVGTNNPSGNRTLFKDATGAVVFQFTLSASSPEDVTVDQISIQASGSGADQDDIASARLFIDVNGDGLLDAGDTLIQSLSDPFGNTDNGSATFNAVNQTINAGQSETWILVYDFNGNGSNGETYQAQITAATNVSVASPATVTGGFAITGQTLTLGGGLVTASGLALSGTMIGPNERNIPALRLRLQETDGQNTLLTAVTVRFTGSGDPSDIDKVQLYSDFNSNGVVDEDDQILGAGSISTTLSFENLNFSIPASQARDLLLTFDMKDAGLVAPGETYSLQIQSGDLVIQSVAVGEAITVSGTFPIDGNTLTVPPRALDAATGANNPGAGFAFNNDSDVAMLQLDVTATPANSGAAVTLTGFQIQFSGTGNDNEDLSAVKLYRDVNKNGLVDPGDGAPLATLSGAGLPADNGIATFSGLTFVVAQGETESLLLALDLNGSASVTETFQTSITDATFLTVNAPATVSGTFPIDGRVLTIGAGAVTLSQPSTPPLTLFPNRDDAVMLHLRLAESSGEAVLFQSLTAQGSGSGDESTDILSVILVRDSNSNGALDPTDGVISARSFATDNGSVTFSGLTETISANGSRDYFVVYVTADTSTLVATDAFTVTIPVGGITVLSSTVQREVPATPLPQAGVSREVNPAVLSLSAGDNNPLALTNVANNATNQVVLQLSLSADQSGDVNVTQLDLQSSGTGDESTDISTVELYIDSDGDGRLDAGEAMIRSASFAADNGALSFTNLAQVIAAGETRNWIVVYNFNGNATDAETFNVQVDSGGLTVDSPATVSATFPISSNGLTINNNAAVGGTATASQPIAVATFIGPDFMDIPLLALRVTDTSGQDLRLRSLAVTASGTGQDDIDLTRLKLWIDADSSGTVNAGDTQVGISQFLQDDGRAGFAGLSTLITASNSLDLLVTSDTASDSLVRPGETFTVTVAAGDLDLVVNSNGAAVLVSGLPQSGPEHIVPAPSVEVSLGANTPSGAIPGISADVPMAQFQFAPNGGGDVLIQELTLTASGSGDESTDITEAKIFLDADGDGVADGPALKTLTAPFSADNGTVMFSALNILIENTGKASLIVTYSFSNQLSVSSDFALSIASVNDVVVAAPTTVTGTFPITANTLTANGTLSITAVEVSATRPRALPPSSTNEPILFLELSASLEDMALTNLMLRAMGTADDSVFENARLYIDDGDGVFEPGADDGAAITSIANAFGQDNGELSFTINQTIQAGTPQRWWFSVDTGAALSAGASFQAVFPSNDSATAVGQTTASTLVVGAPAISENFLTDNPNALFGAANTEALAFPTAVVQDLKTGDFNRDGAPDYIVLSGNGRIEVKLGNGDGSFNAGPSGGSFPGADTANPQRMAIGDMNRDGYLDVVVVYNDRLRVFFNDGAGANAGAFTSQVDFMAAGASLKQLALIDVDRDGDLDTLTANNAPNELRLRRNDGMGGLGAVSSITTPVDPTTGTLHVADINGDGIQDVLVGEASSTASGNNDVVVLFTGNGSGLDRQQSASINLDTPFNMTTVDMNRNSFPDLFVTREGNSDLVSFLPNAMRTGFTFGTSLDTTLTQASGLLSGDFNGDGFPDLAIGGGNSTDFAIVLGLGQTSFSSTTVSRYTVGSRENRLATADFNFDGDPDLVLGSSIDTNGSVSVVLGDGTQGTASFDIQAPISTNSFNTAPIDTAIGDLDRDGDLDIVVLVAGSPHKALIYLNEGSGRGYTRFSEVTLSGSALRVELADLNRDGTLDLVVLVSGAFNGFEFFSGTRDGRFQAAVRTATSNNATPTEFALGDINRDGTTDAVAIFNGEDSFQIFLNDGTRLLPSSNQTSTGDGPVGLALGDMNNDGILDVVVTTANDNQVQTFLGDGAAAFTGQTAFAVPANAQPPGIVRLGELNDDGQLDAFVASSGSAQLLVLDGQGTGIFNQALNFNGGGGQTNDIRLVDLDRDGDLDFIRATTNGSIRYRRNIGTNNNFQVGTPRTENHPAGISVTARTGDVNGDGDQDVVTVCTTSNDIQIFLGE